MTQWFDEYQCDNCGEGYGRGVGLPGVPWGEHQSREGGNGTVVYDRVRHPTFPDFDSDTPEHPSGDGVCRVCGGYALGGLLCDPCRADGYDDAYGVITETEPEDECDCGYVGDLDSGEHVYNCVC